MDWFVLLTPLLVLLLLPPVIVFGCSIQEYGEGVLAKRSLVVHYAVPATLAGKLTQLSFEFQLAGGSAKDLIQKTENLDPQIEQGTTVAQDHGLFVKGTKVSSTCKVTFIGWPTVHPPVPLSAGSEDTDDTIVFDLSWNSKVWSDPLKNYDDVQFSLMSET